MSTTAQLDTDINGEQESENLASFSLRKFEEENRRLREQLSAAKEALIQTNIWLKSCLECKSWSWDADQHEAASGSLAFAQETVVKLA